ncbi:MAG: hypothetical protein NVV82_00200 [Sporocytophaga sp.]|nr:hypothetical protein [Sporocytophaga sp.]
MKRRALMNAKRVLDESGGLTSEQQDEIVTGAVADTVAEVEADGYEGAEFDNFKFAKNLRKRVQQAISKPLSIIKKTLPMQLIAPGMPKPGAASLLNKMRARRKAKRDARKKQQEEAASQGPQSQMPYPEQSEDMGYPEWEDEGGYEEDWEESFAEDDDTPESSASSNSNQRIAPASLPVKNEVKTVSPSSKKGVLKTSWLIAGAGSLIVVLLAILVFRSFKTSV